MLSIGLIFIFISISISVISTATPLVLKLKIDHIDLNCISRSIIINIEKQLSSIKYYQQ